MATIDTTNYTIDIVRHAVTGQQFVARINSVWTDEETNQDCIGYAITAMAGPLTDAEIAHLHADPHGWEEDRGFDLEAVTAEYRADGDWREVQEIYPGGAPASAFAPR